MKKNYLIGMLMLGIGIPCTHAQHAVLASGGNASGSGGSVSYSVGQIACSYQSFANGSINQGVQQPYEFFSVGIDNHEDINLSMSVFPNPTNATVSLVMKDENPENMFFQLYDLNGKQILNREIKNSITVIPMEIFAQGSYTLNVFNKKSLLKTFTLIKNQ